ncbi:MAG TPA: hypothetical protein ENL07_04550 [Chlorobaculum parvum]|uniref:Uncharacterized protein n=1 Tax=Chlorobaculum parvum TaxID=274539 RepID=A0A7C5HBS7_9CHLB|nr:hypothetical protein [Chlorobaculum parvum]
MRDTESRRFLLRENQLVHQFGVGNVGGKIGFNCFEPFVKGAVGVQGDWIGKVLYWNYVVVFPQLFGLHATAEVGAFAANGGEGVLKVIGHIFWLLAVSVSRFSATH